jgi:MFS family permease
MQIVNTWTLATGKFLNGLCVTVVHIANIKMINETVPVQLLGACGTVVNFMMSVGYYLVLGLGYFLPAGDYDPELINDEQNEKAKQADVDDQFWRLLYLIPVVINVIMLLNFVIFIKEDSIMFNLSEDNEAEALILIDKVYHAQEDRQEILAALKN